MRQIKRAIYAGSFDPLTNGHLWMIYKGIRVFDELIVAVGTNPDKKTIFSLKERIAMLRETTSGIRGITVSIFSNEFLVRYAEAVDVSYILRGIRNGGDYEYERTMRHINEDLSPEITTVFLMPPRELAEVSSSFVRGLVGPKGWEKVVKKYVPACVLIKLKEKHNFNAKAGV